jgi:S-adenosylmethionine:tRNA ribosyltransferase-isomerase
MSIHTRDYDYALPDALIARRPLPRREDSRMMVLHRAEERIEHRRFAEFAAFLREADLVVLNDTRVLPARVFSVDGKIELLCLDQVGEKSWKCLVKPGRRMQPGKSVKLSGNEGRVVEILPGGERIIMFEQRLDLHAIGCMPLPHYIGREAEAMDTARYQTVYARSAGAVAAPTAGLHFTPEILRTIPHAFVTLHVGIGTFKPVQTELITNHQMHAERFAISESAAQSINRAQRIIAVGTTTARVLEACMAHEGKITAHEGATDIFIYPPFEFRAVDALLTNFHLPKSTLLMLVSAFAGRDFVMRAYAEAVREQYRFYSYGDCMLIL